MKGANEQIFGDLEADEVAIGVGSVAAFGDLHDVETEFSFEMFDRRLVVSDIVSKFSFQVGVKHRDGVIGGDAMAVIVGGVVSEGAESESIFIEGGGIAEKRFDKIAGAHVVDEIAEKMAAERIVAEILNDRAAIGVRMSLF